MFIKKNFVFFSEIEHRPKYHWNRQSLSPPFPKNIAGRRHFLPKWKIDILFRKIGYFYFKIVKFFIKKLTFFSKIFQNFQNISGALWLFPVFGRMGGGHRLAIEVDFWIFLKFSISLGFSRWETDCAYCRSIKMIA